MKFRSRITVVLLVAAALAVAFLPACSNGPPLTTRDLANSSGAAAGVVSNAQMGAAAINAALDASKAQIPPGVSTKSIDTAQLTITRAAADVTKAAPIVNAVNTSLQTSAAQPSSDPLAAGISAAGAGATAAAPMAGAYAGYVVLGGIGLSLLGNLLQAFKNRSQATAAQANVDAVQSAIANGHITVASPETAAAAVNAVVADHPMGDQLVDAIASAPAKS